MRKQGVFSAIAAVLWIVLGHGIINLAELMGPVAAALLFSLGAATLAEIWKEAGTRVNPPLWRLWVIWFFVLPWLLLLAWARFIAPETATGIPGLLMVFFGGSSEGPVLLQIVRAAHVGIGAALMAWSLIELIAGSQRSKPRP